MYFYVFTGVFELHGAAGFTNSIIVLDIPPHYCEYKYMEGRYKVLDASSWALGNRCFICFFKSHYKRIEVFYY